MKTRNVTERFQTDDASAPGRWLAVAVGALCGVVVALAALHVGGH